MEYYIAALRGQVAMMFTKDNSLTLDDFLLTFTPQDAELKQQRRLARKTRAVFDQLEDADQARRRARQR
ncbi:MAG TPA: hypothetical protein PLG59_00585 [bacterium]|nr:hypothetical protein [bacterium]